MVKSCHFKLLRMIFVRVIFIRFCQHVFFVLLMFGKKGLFILDRAWNNFFRYFTNNGANIAASPLDYL